MPWLTTEETADRYRISVSGLLKQRREDRKPGALGRRVGKRVLWASEELDAFDGHEEPESFGALHALVLEAQGINKRLDAVLVELRKGNDGPEGGESRTQEDGLQASPSDGTAAGGDAGDAAAASRRDGDMGNTGGRG